MTKNIDVRIGGQPDIRRIQITEETTAADALSLAQCPPSYNLSPTVGEGVFGKDELIFDRVKEGGKVIATPVADAGKVS